MTQAPHSLRPVEDDDVKTLLEAISQASRELLQLWPGRDVKASKEVTSSSLGVQTKEDGSLVSQADFRSNEILIKALREVFPADTIISEEGVGEGLERAKGAGLAGGLPYHSHSSTRYWIIDPLDGTSSFLHGRDDFSILAGCWQAGVPLLGIMNFPVRKLLVIARSGQGCSVNGKLVSVSTFVEPRPGCVYMRNFTPKFPELACSPRDSGLALLEVASGELDAAIIRMTTHRVWDLAAPIVAILEAGGTVTDEMGRPIVCGSEELSAKYVIATNTKCHLKALTLFDA
jgi:myo-inositol-1(or 4)-monophosphatase